MISRMIVLQYSEHEEDQEKGFTVFSHQVMPFRGVIGSTMSLAARACYGLP